MYKVRYQAPWEGKKTPENKVSVFKEWLCFSVTKLRSSLPKKALTSDFLRINYILVLGTEILSTGVPMT